MQPGCEVLRTASEYVRKWLSKQPAVKEESLTDWLLFEISSNTPRIRYAAFSRHTEARETGADWEWWILFRELSVRLRVQAKKLFKADNYAGIAHTNRHGLQIDLLLAAADRVNALPFYAFYSGDASSTMCGGGRHDEGVFMAGGRRVHTDFISCGRKTVSDSDALSRCTPLSCFLCCPLLRGRGDPVEFFRHYYAKELEFPAQPQAENIRGMYSSLPGFVSSFLETSEQGLPDWWEQEFQSAVYDIKGLLVYDGREDEG
jgi:hypothetical protein